MAIKRTLRKLAATWHETDQDRSDNLFNQAALEIADLIISLKEAAGDVSIEDTLDAVNDSVNIRRGK